MQTFEIKGSRRNHYSTYLSPLMTFGVAVFITYLVLTLAPFEIFLQYAIFAVFLAIAFIFYWLGFQILKEVFKSRNDPVINANYEIKSEYIEFTHGTITTLIKYADIVQLEEPREGIKLIEAKLKDGQVFKFPVPDSGTEFYASIKKNLPAFS